jgi:hypothetical protein
MKDEIVQTCFSPMDHYLIAMGVGLRGSSRERAAP